MELHQNNMESFSASKEELVQFVAGVLTTLENDSRLITTITREKFEDSSARTVIIDWSEDIATLTYLDGSPNI